MDSAEHHRQQAETLSRLAILTTDPETACLLRLLEAEYATEADQAASKIDRTPAQAAA